MKISKITRDYIRFDNGKRIEYYHEQSCCECNYADFEAIDDLARDFDFNENLDFEECKYGFKFGNKPNNMFFVPCYSEQNGWYSQYIDIIYNKKEVIKDLTCEMRENEVAYLDGTEELEADLLTAIVWNRADV